MTLEQPQRGDVALVTGAGRGIGRALALGLAQHGLRVAALGRTPETVADAAAACRSVGVEAMAVVADVTDDSSVRQAVATVTDAWGRVDLLVNNAGRVDTGDVGFADAALDDVLGVLEVNLLGVMRVTHAVLPAMLAAGRGRIMNVNSGFGYRREATTTGYALSKGALARFTDLLAFQLADHGIVVLDVSPGLVRTDMTESMPMWQRMDDPPWGDPARIVGVARALADGRLDALSGRFVHAGSDDLAVLADRVAHDRDARTVGLRRYGPDDPLR